MVNCFGVDLIVVLVVLLCSAADLVTLFVCKCVPYASLKEFGVPGGQGRARRTS